MLFNIQVLRGLAAILVVWIHAQWFIPVDYVPVTISHFGYGGVDLFFVISGFIMVHTTQDKQVNPYKFIKNRLTRICPLYYGVTLFVFILSFLVPSAFNSTLPEIHHLLKSLFFIPFEKTDGRIYPTYYLGWTLNFEIFFYFIFAFSLLLGKRIRFYAVAAILVGLAIAGVLIDSPANQGVAAFFYTRPIILNFAFGMAIAFFLVSARRVPPALCWILLVLGTCWFLLGGAFTTFGDGPVLPPTDTVLRFGIPSALVVAAAAGLDRSGVRLGTKLMRRAGDASYSIYLSHYLFVAVVIASVDRFDLSTFARALMAPLTIVAAVFVGFLTHQLIERPLGGNWSAYARILGYRRSLRMRTKPGLHAVPDTAAIKTAERTTDI